MTNPRLSAGLPPRGLSCSATCRVARHRARRGACPRMAPWSSGSAGRRLARRLFRWTREGGMKGLTAIPTDLRRRTRATSVSYDGNVVAGYNYAGDEPDRAFRWTSETGLVGLG